MSSRDNRFKKGVFRFSSSDKLIVDGDLEVTGSISGDGFEPTEPFTFEDVLTLEDNLVATSADFSGAVTAATTLAVTGVVSKKGNNGSAINVKEAHVSHTCNSGTNTETLTALIPAGARVQALSARVTTILAGTSLTTWKLGDAGDDDRYGATLALAAGTTVTQSNATADPAGTWSASARDIILKAAAGQFDSGVVEVSVFYTDSTAPVS